MLTKILGPITQREVEHRLQAVPKKQLCVAYSLKTTFYIGARSSTCMRYKEFVRLGMKICIHYSAGPEEN